MADPQQVRRILASCGVTVRLEGDRLIATPRHRLNDELRRLIARFKPELIAHLDAERQLAETVANALALSEPEYQLWVREIRRAPLDDPNSTHDREAYRRTKAIRAARHSESEVA